MCAIWQKPATKALTGFQIQGFRIRNRSTKIRLQQNISIGIRSPENLNPNKNINSVPVTDPEKCFDQ